MQTRFHSLSVIFSEHFTLKSVENISARIDDIYFKENMTKMSLYKVELRLQKLEDFTFEAIEQLSSLKSAILQQQSKPQPQPQPSQPRPSQSSSTKPEAMPATVFRSSLRHRTLTIGTGTGQPTTLLLQPPHLHHNNFSFPSQPAVRSIQSRLLNHSVSNIETAEATTKHSPLTPDNMAAGAAAASALAMSVVTRRKRYQSDLQDYTVHPNILNRDGALSPIQYQTHLPFEIQIESN